MKIDSSMTQQRNTTRMLWILGVAIAVVQVVDIVIHAATDQVEILRILSNLIVLFWVVGVVWGRFKTGSLPMSVGAVGVYLLLNLTFLALEGVTNPAQGDAPRIMLFLLVLLTLGLSGWLVVVNGKRTVN
jgi:hypothetical protein